MEFLSLNDILKKYQKVIENGIQESIASFGPKTQLRDAIEYALISPGKRFRPAIVLMMAESLKKGSKPLEAALGIEFFHTASLIADDLPCMDNDAFRRERPSLHVVFGETIAILSTYALISAGYQKLALESQKSLHCGSGICELVLENVAQNTGVFGATGGQYLDLSLKKPTEKEIMLVIEKKTGTLFEISFILGWLFGGGERSSLEKIKKMALHFGRAFQIMDDFIDLKQDKEKENPFNYPLIAGEKKGKEILLEELEALFCDLEELNLLNSSLGELALWLQNISKMIKP